MMKISVRYLRPGRDTREWEQDILADREDMIVSSFRFRLEKPFSPFNQRILIEDGYFGMMFDLLDRWYNVVKIYDEKKELVGYYSDIRTPPEKIRSEKAYQAKDLFLDFWVDLDGTYIILDIDEFQKADLTPEMRGKAKRAARDLKELIEASDYPPSRVEEFDLPQDVFEG